MGIEVLETENFGKNSADSKGLKNKYSFDEILSPLEISDFYGQDNVIKPCGLMLGSALKSGSPLHHILITGPPGLGKTSLAHLLAIKMNAKIHTISGSALNKKCDLAAIVTNISKNEILFIDEIHRMTSEVEEILYSVLANGTIEIVIGQKNTKKVVSIELSPFTVIGATTQAGLISRPLRERFSGNLFFDIYKEWAMEKMIGHSFASRNIKISKKALGLLACSSRGTPRIAKNLLLRLCDLMIIKDLFSVTDEVVAELMEILGIDYAGLTEKDRNLLHCLSKYFDGGPVGIKSLSSVFHENSITIEEVYEPFLLSKGFITRTTRGRMLSKKGYDYLRQNC